MSDFELEALLGPCPEVKAARYGDDWTGQNPIVIHTSLGWTISDAGPGLITIGCETRTVEDWETQQHRLGDGITVDTEAVEMFREAIRFIRRWGRQAVDRPVDPLHPKTISSDDPAPERRA